MQFRTEIHLPTAPDHIARTKGILTLGSCFADAMGRRLQEAKANVLVNPFGTVFNPVSIHKLLRAAILNRGDDLEKGLVERNGLWFHYDFHSSFSHPQRDILLQMLEEVIQKTHTFLQTAHTVMLTWGTSYVYERLDSENIVANCHKIPQKSFRKRLLSLEEITQDTKRTLALLKERYPYIQVILTVSPVRHIKDTLPLNSVSKSLLRVAAHMAMEFHSNITYFPAYELLLDDLRDYRFYASDLLHPSEMAETYIWEKFIETYADQEFLTFLAHWEEVKRELAHRAFQPESPAHKKFLQKLLQKLQNLAHQADVQSEIETVQHQLRML